ncbi:hypothetical protein WA158_000508 [Blastocystis sp. Blastoise]
MLSRVLSSSLLRANYHTCSTLFKTMIVPVPQMGESIKEGTLVQWEKHVGDKVSIDDVIAVVETDKVSIDVRSDYMGILKKQYNEPDDVIIVNEPLAAIEVPDN